MKQIIDVTYLAHWQGKLTGIPRVIHEIVSRRVSGSNAAVFVVWDNAMQSFIEVDIEKTIVDRGKKLHYKKTDTTSASQTATVLATKVLRKAKSQYKVPVPGRVLNKLSSQGTKGYKLLELQKDDILFLTMGEWHNQAYIDQVLSYHERGARLVQICYDVLPLVQPQYSGHSTESQKQYNTAIMPKCELVLAISENTKKDLAQWLSGEGLIAPEIKVFRLGEDFEISKPKQPENLAVKEALSNDPRYLLCVGTFEARKNHTLLYYTYKLAKHKNIDLPVILIVGRRGWKTDDLYELITKDPDTKDKILLLQDIDDNELSWLYDNTLFCVYASFYEGWGLPIAESASRGVVCLASNTSSMPEIAGNLIPYFNPLSSDSALEGIQRLLDTKNLVAARAKVAKYRQTTWAQTSEQIESYIKEL